MITEKEIRDKMYQLSLEIVRARHNIDNLFKFGFVDSEHQYLKEAEQEFENAMNKLLYYFKEHLPTGATQIGVGTSPLEPISPIAEATKTNQK